MFKIELIISFYLIQSVWFTSSQVNNSFEAENNIRNKIFTSYNNRLRPSNIVSVGLKFSLFKISNIDEVNGIMHSSIIIFAEWFDKRLTWDPFDYNNLTYIFIQASEIWTPDLFATNTADKNGYIIDNESLAFAMFNGYVFISIGLHSILFYIIYHILSFNRIHLIIIGFSSKCKINIYKYPYDTQICSIAIGSWFMSQGKYFKMFKYLIKS